MYQKNVRIDLMKDPQCNSEPARKSNEIAFGSLSRKDILNGRVIDMKKLELH